MTTGETTLLPDPGLSIGRSRRSIDWGRVRSFFIKVAIRVAILAVIIISWQLCSGRLVPTLVASSPSAIWQEFGTWIGDGQLFSQLGITMQEAGFGFLYGSLAGAALGLLFGMNEFIAQTVSPFVNALYALPKIMLAPLIVVWFGIGLEMKVVLSTLSVVFLVFYNVWNATRQLDQSTLNQFRLMGASVRATIISLYLPSAATWLLISLRIAFPLALIGAIVGEFIASNSGIGYMVLDSASQFNSAGVYVGIITITVAAVCVDSVLAVVQRAVARWQGSGAGV